eukprot:m.13332 g.13332  ORF g.13332 m.13332 type:complete len:103 (-) comp3295_c0_seq2:397-705(-)
MLPAVECLRALCCSLRATTERPDLEATEPGHSQRKDTLCPLLIIAIAQADATSSIHACKSSPSTPCSVGWLVCSCVAPTCEQAPQFNALSTSQEKVVQRLVQ